MVKFNLSRLILGVLKDEVVITKGAGKFILIAIFFNIPVWGFIPWVSQALTIILLFFFLKHAITDKDKEKYELKSKNVSHSINHFGYYLIIATIIVQFPFFFLPFISQIFTLVLLGIIYVTMTSYKEK